MATSLPLPTLLSQALVAFTIELDNEFERQMPHRLTASRPGAPVPGASPGRKPIVRPWLVSLVMWSNFMQFVGEEGVSVHELQRLARITNEGMHTSLAGMTRWGYVVARPDPADGRRKPPGRDWLVRPTAAGRRAQEVWRELPAAIEQRWRARFGEDLVNELRESLRGLVSLLDVELPEYLPLLRYGLRAEVPDHVRRVSAGHDDLAASPLHLPALLSQVLLAFTLDFERESDLSLAISANVVRIIADGGVRLRDLPRVAGVSKEAISTSAAFLEKRGFAAREADPAGSRAKILRLTSKGDVAHDSYGRLLVVIERRWLARFGEEEVRNLRRSLEALAGMSGGLASPLWLGLEPPAGVWRAGVRRPEAFPHHPMVLHRGGFPDGS